jgi:hypothetical protein
MVIEKGRIIGAYLQDGPGKLSVPTPTLSYASREGNLGSSESQSNLLHKLMKPLQSAIAAKSLPDSFERFAGSHKSPGPTYYLLAFPRMVSRVLCIRLQDLLCEELRDFLVPLLLKGLDDSTRALLGEGLIDELSGLRWTLGHREAPTADNKFTDADLEEFTEGFQMAFVQAVRENSIFPSASDTRREKDRLKGSQVSDPVAFAKLLKGVVYFFSWTELKPSDVYHLIKISLHKTLIERHSLQCTLLGRTDFFTDRTQLGKATWNDVNLLVADIKIALQKERAIEHLEPRTTKPALGVNPVRVNEGTAAVEPGAGQDQERLEGLIRQLIEDSKRRDEALSKQISESNTSRSTTPLQGAEFASRSASLSAAVDGGNPGYRTPERSPQQGPARYSPGPKEWNTKSMGSSPLSLGTRNAYPGGSRRDLTCWVFAKTGECNRGKECKFLHQRNPQLTETDLRESNRVIADAMAGKSTPAQVLIAHMTSISDVRDDLEAHVERLWGDADASEDQAPGVTEA